MPKKTPPTLFPPTMPKAKKRPKPGARRVFKPSPSEVKRVETIRVGPDGKPRF